MEDRKTTRKLEGRYHSADSKRERRKRSRILQGSNNSAKAIQIIHNGFDREIEGGRREQGGYFAESNGIQNGNGNNR